MVCANGETYESDLKGGKSCKFDYKDLYKATECTEEKQYGYNTDRPCVLIKLNKMIDYIPIGVNGSKVIQIKCAPDVNPNTYSHKILKILAFIYFS